MDAGRSSTLDQALCGYRPGHALSRDFHVDATIYAEEIERVWRHSWLFAGFSIEAVHPGHFFSFELGDDALLIVRGDDGRLHALHNSCRHRGSRVCDLTAGRTKRWVCPYHQWSYALDGTLLGAGGLERELDLSEHDLLRAPVVEIGGLVYVWLAAGPAAPFGGAEAALGGALAPQGIDRARIAHRADYQVQANWKLVWENNRECWHCHIGHPEYVQANFDAVPDTERNRELSAARAQEHRLALGEPAANAELMPDEHSRPGLYRFPTPGRWWSANRTPLMPGFVTESLDGAPVSTLMGDYANRDTGTLRVRTVPNMWMHASSDHAVVTQLLPGGPDTTHVRVNWLVDADAREGQDYSLDALVAFWQLTSEQDWTLCERNHAGVRNPAYFPGPYSPSREYNVQAFVDWYLARMRVSTISDGPGVCASAPPAPRRP
jgi:Rieske 2Fe-2S family protein